MWEYVGMNEGGEEITQLEDRDPVHMFGLCNTFIAMLNRTLDNTSHL